jgi:hypothetical protein
LCFFERFLGIGADRRLIAIFSHKLRHK